MKHRSLAAALLTVVLAWNCTPEPEPDTGLVTWSAQMEAARGALEGKDLAAAQLHYEAAADLARADGRLRLVVRSLEGLAHQAAGRGDLAAADSLFQSILALQLDSLRTTGVAADDLLTTLGTLGDICLRTKQLDRADAYFSQLMSLADDGWIDLTPQRQHLSLVLAGQARVLLAQGDSMAASAMGARATGLRQYAQAYGLYVGQKYSEAETQFRSVLDYQRQLQGPDHPDVARTVNDLAHVLDLLGRSEEASALRQQ
ncbi:MAG: tetratricopeptide repeat protein [Gemmatimonadetes bacterium]|nr:tetratricopeptide repeat protein [Gemmatimonadota bacterium]MBT5056119.1 tetratricopeptide repeat protein [Gemmatimonadota bacterium]MBT5141104.1 tetratricopeptide repeat protein [Gemmatimonadota bacterium]MBT5586466.1 tetratricopeptide repeat protein [Gemmatimonadota bacterium]MBT5964673.1 tetratricopeptide repeat protein [Gemmatimonadota bacterium]